MRIDAVQTIKSQLSMRKVAEYYGYTPNRSGFICCPFHREKTPSMKIYDNSYYCFGCGASGDVISFVQAIFNIDFSEVLHKIDTDFKLNIYAAHTFEELRRSHYQQKKLQAEAERKKQESEQAEADYWKVFDEWKRLDDNKRNYAPKTPSEEWHPLYVEALQKIAYQEYLLDCAEEKR